MSSTFIKVRFFIMDRQDLGLSYHTFQNPHGMYRQYAKNPEQTAGTYECGPKDILISYPGTTVTRIMVIFDIAGEYVWHCVHAVHFSPVQYGSSPPGRNLRARSCAYLCAVYKYFLAHTFLFCAFFLFPFLSSTLFHTKTT